MAARSTPDVAPAAVSDGRSAEARRTALRRIGCSAVVLALGVVLILVDRAGGTTSPTPVSRPSHAGSAGSPASADPAPADSADGPVATRSADDLGLPTAISNPPCTGGFALFVGAAVDPARYRRDVERFLGAHPDAHYLRTAASCSSLARPSNGNDIYAVYYGPFATLAEVCAQKRRSNGDSYIRRLDDVSPVGQVVSC